VSFGHARLIQRWDAPACRRENLRLRA